MASKKKQSEGIALLSMYNDDGDDEMEDAEEEEEEMHEEQEGDAAGPAAEEDLAADTDRMTVVESVSEVAAEWSVTMEKSRTPQENRLFSPPLEQQRVESRISRSGTLTIVDYGHDEVAMSPEPEEGEIDGSGRVMFGDQLHVTNGDLLDRTPSGIIRVLSPSNQANTPQLSKPLKSDNLNNDPVIRPDDVELGEAEQDEQKSVDPLDKFLPPPPKDKCSEELQRKINKFLEYKKAGKSFNAEVRNRKDYRNPDFLLHAVRYQDIDQIGSCFSKDVFDPHGYDPSDFYDEIEADMRRESDRKEQEKKRAQNQKVEFSSGGTQPGIVLGAPRISMPVTGASVATTSGLHLMPPVADSINRDGRQNKKSKWDKVDGDRKNPLPSVGQDSVSTVGAHAATLSGTNAGGGYMLFAQQKRREAEEKRSTERRLERRS